MTIDELAREIQTAWDDVMTPAVHREMDYRMARIAAERVIGVIQAGQVITVDGVPITDH